MPTDGNDPPDSRIEPIARPIGLLSFGQQAGNDSIRTLQSFAGFLYGRQRSATLDEHRPGQPPKSGQFGPELEFLRLQSLVIQHVNEPTTREMTVETVERTERTVVSGEASDDEEASSDDASPDSMTVREYIRRQGEEGRAESTDSDAAGDRSSDRKPERHDVDHTVVRQDSDAGDHEAPDSDRDLTTSPDASPRDRQAPSDTPATPSSPRDEPQPWTTLDTGPPESVAGSGGESAGFDSQSETPTTPSEGHEQSGGRGRTRQPGPDLVVADAGPSGLRPTEGTQSGDDGPTTLSSHSSGGEQSRERGRNSQSSSPEAPSDPHSREQPKEQSTAEFGAQAKQQVSQSEGIPLSLDQVEQPTLDRFVEQLSEKLARHERVERERRGL